jgi:UDP-2,3-diacylglucosamine pyrophosphatase LpxH
LHLDKKYDNNSDKFFNPDRSKKDRFIDLLKQHKDDIVIIVGDFYNDYLESIKIIKEIDEMGIHGF